MRTIVFGLPYAGGGASFYRNWPPLPADSDVEMVGAQLPGREEMFDEPWPRSMADTVTFVREQIAAKATARDRIALFGHSFGALLAYEVARSLCGDGHVPAHLFVSGSADPSTPLAREPAPDTDSEFLQRVESLAGYAHPALAIPGLREVVLPTLRADVELHESLHLTVVDPLPVAVTALRGREDHLVEFDDCERWAKVTTVGCEVVELPGGHMYVLDDPGPVLGTIRRVLES
jgi:surfactin synthase thioesterase subunit